MLELLLVACVFGCQNGKDRSSHPPWFTSW
jgi:hypothetical protein